MEAEKFIYYTLVIFLIVGFAAGVGFSLYTEEEPEEINHSERFDRIENEIVNFGVDYSDRFDRIEAGIINSAIDVCFRWGGQYITDKNNLVVQDFRLPLPDGSFLEAEAIFCVKEKQGVNQ